MKLISSAFKNNEKIPEKYTCDGENISPPLEINEVPKNTKSLVLIMDDPDLPEEVKQARGIKIFDHWVVFNIDPTISVIEEGSAPLGTIQGANGRGESKYTGPCPPPQYKPTEHRYFFKLYALDIKLNFLEGITKTEVEKAIKKHILEQTKLIGRYERKELLDLNLRESNLKFKIMS